MSYFFYKKKVKITTDYIKFDWITSSRTRPHNRVILSTVSVVNSPEFHELQEIFNLHEKRNIGYSGPRPIFLEFRDIIKVKKKLTKNLKSFYSSSLLSQKKVLMDFFGLSATLMCLRGKDSSQLRARQVISSNYSPMSPHDHRLSREFSIDCLRVVKLLILEFN